MSDNNGKALITGMEGDFTMKDMDAIQKFKDEGMVGLAKVTDVDIERCMNLYLDGKSYRQIANITKIPKTTILFVAQRLRWWELKQDYLEELRVTLGDKILEQKLRSQEFLVDLIQAYQKKLYKNVNMYLKTDNEDYADKMDSKDIGTVLKVMELLYKFNLDTAGTQADKSLVSLNGMGEGVTITKTGANSVEITPKSPFSNKLKAFADLKRQQEKASEQNQKSSDINNQEQTNKTSTESENS